MRAIIKSIAAASLGLAALATAIPAQAQNAGGGFIVLTGIVSWGEGCARPNKFGVYTRVGNASIRNFITGKIGP